MKTLYLMRHAKSSWKDPALGDRERPLKGRGRRDAPEMGRRLAERGPLPQLILCSPARRARETAEAVAAGGGFAAARLVIDERLYFRGRSGWLEAVRDLRDTVDTLLMVGHNPDFSEVVSWLGMLPGLDLPTAAMARFDLDPSAYGIGPQAARLRDLDWPRKSD